ncbi:MAG: GNAT family N-acetyltransferase [Propionibacteriales bacterium]|nr:GNAT family N-acetyltransferase [Propionibacteriales bacterium]
MKPGWAVTVAEGRIGVRPIRLRDGRAWRRLRARNRSWLHEWDATLPPGGEETASSYGRMVRQLRSSARAGRALPYVSTYDGAMVGQVGVHNIVWGSACFGQVSYWIDEAHAGREIVPTAVALLGDHCFRRLGLHRLEIAVRPENTASVRVAEKLGFTLIGMAPRYLHINGAWRDHHLYAVTVEDVPEGLLARWSQRRR